MTELTIVESGMVFGPFRAEDCWYIECSACYRRIIEGVQMAEFLRIEHRQNRPPRLWVVEAKTGCPKPGQPEFDEFIGKVCAKLTNAMMLAVAACLGRHPESESDLPASFKALDLAKVDFFLVLVIKGDPGPWPEAWLEDPQKALDRKLIPLRKTWELSPTPVWVFNEALARENGLILDNTSVSSAAQD
jgi:hypothetical protein